MSEPEAPSFMDGFREYLLDESRARYCALAKHVFHDRRLYRRGRKGVRVPMWFCVEAAWQAIVDPPILLPVCWVVDEKRCRCAFPEHWKYWDRLFHPLLRHGGRREKAVERNASPPE